MSSFTEKEISYSINFSQELLYIILSSYISKKYTLVQQYTDFVDENDARTRLIENCFETTRKTPQSLQKRVFIHNNALVPLVDRTSVEQGVNHDQVSFNLKRISTCRVYKTPEQPQIEIKFEKVYFEKNVGDTFDSLIATKQVALLNLLQNKHERITQNTHLGSDEIMAYLRIEYEYDGDTPDETVLVRMAQIVTEIDAHTHYQNIAPMLPYTALQNNIIYRKFENEILINALSPDDNVYKWAIKLDGIRGKGLFVRNFIIVFMDDMRMFSGPCPWLFCINNVVAFQCELVNDSVLYITDLLQVFKYTYNNRTQYECSLNGYAIEPAAAIDCLNYLYQHTKSLLQIEHDGGMIQVQFQQFMNPPIAIGGYTTMPTDGYIVLNKRMQYVKCKYAKTLELEYNAEQSVFYTLEVALNKHKIESNIQLEHGKIYEVIVRNNNVLSVIKLRKDRLIPQTL
uniref:LEF-4 n=1 Tax=Buzura suppressaria nuclear polyhedrosis virus TaxID=74320 RepID=A0A0N7CPH2_NPVBS|nr:LEF-4 [Buzura suppressaria nucleopolyhedrovirus]